MKFHVTTKLGRSDTQILESSSLSTLLTFFSNVSLAVVRNVKELVFSKDYNINYTNQNYVPEDTYYKVLIFAYSENHSQKYALYDIRKTVTHQQIETQFSKLYIFDEPILGFYTIDFYDEGGDSPTDLNYRYQVQYKRDSQTRIEDFYAPSWQILKDVVLDLIDGEITEIRKYVHIDNNLKDESLNKNCYKYVNVKLDKNNSVSAFRIPRVKNNIEHNQLITSIKDTFKINNSTVDDNDIEVKYC